MAQRETGRNDTRQVFGVGQLLAGLNGLLEDRVGRVWVAGELSNLHAARSGHSYFTLKDADGQIRAALFRSAASRVPFELEEGLEVVVHAEVSIYAARGDLQLIVRQMEPLGQGALQLAFEQLRRRLEEEGLFDSERKRPIPRFPRRLAVVTSPTGAAVRDVLQVCARRFPAIPVLVVATRVQGAGSEDEIAAALAQAAARADVELVLLVRGGGSLEDLWAFNTETVARAIAASPVAVVTGVGHEVDVTIADLVADLRAATPSVAAELALPDRGVLRHAVARDGARVVSATRRILRDLALALSRERDALKMLAPGARVAAQRSALHSLSLRLQRAVRLRAKEAHRSLALASARLDSLSPLAVLSRGYALVRREVDGSLVKRADQATPGEVISIRLSEGDLRATVSESTRPKD